MKKRILLSLMLAVCMLPLGGCSLLLERSYGGVEPYADRYWDSGAEDTLRAENYQDLINSLLMLVEERAETGTIRGYDEVNSPAQAVSAASEVREETMLGSYLLRSITCSYESGGAYCTLSYQMTYREDTEDIDSVMALSDCQSLADLLRLAVREGHERLTVQFVYGTTQEDVTAAVEALWQELAAAAAPEEVPPPPEGEDTPAEDEAPPETPPACPWTVSFYPDREMAELVEIRLKP